MPTRRTIGPPTWIDGATNDTTQGIPGTVIEPVMEVVESFLHKEASCPIVEVGIKLMDNTFKAQHGEQSSRECYKAANMVQSFITIISL